MGFRGFDPTHRTVIPEGSEKIYFGTSVAVPGVGPEGDRDPLREMWRDVGTPMLGWEADRGGDRDPLPEALRSAMV